LVIDQFAGQFHGRRLLGAVELRGTEDGADIGTGDPLQMNQ
jgi:hypothetical protein